jgi:hypothetical protein
VNSLEYTDSGLLTEDIRIDSCSLKNRVERNLKRQTAEAKTAKGHSKIKPKISLSEGKASSPRNQIDKTQGSYDFIKDGKYHEEKLVAVERKRHTICGHCGRYTSLHNKRNCPRRNRAMKTLMKSRKTKYRGMNTLIDTCIKRFQSLNVRFRVCSMSKESRKS